MKHLLLLASICALLPCCEKPQELAAPDPETLVREYDEQEMDKAIAAARSKVDEFLAVLGEGKADSFSVKAPITDEHGTEHFWLTDVSYQDGQFTGLVGNSPGIVKNVKFGQSWKIRRDEISDWMFIRDGMMHGGFTIDPLLPMMSESEAAEIRAKLVR